jgi:tetratricopeptide (TPR) repeat protein
MLIALHPLAAFRADTSAAPDNTTQEDGEWLTVASLVARAADLPKGERVAALRTLVAHSASAGSADPVADAIALAVRSATAMEDAARFHLAFTTLAGVLQLLPENDVLGRGRVLAQQGRIARQLGEHGQAKERYEAVDALATTVDGSHVAAELHARAWVGFGILAHIRGNLPDARTWFRRVLATEHVPREQQQVAHTQLMIAAAAAKDFDIAAVHAWAAFESADGQQKLGALSNLAQVLLDAGHPKLALRGFGSILARTPIPRWEFTALSGAALAAARGLPAGRARPLVEQFASRLQALLATIQLPWSQAVALADVSDAYSALGATNAAAQVRDQAIAVADRYGFHELSYRLRESQAAPALTRVTPLRRAAGVAEQVESFQTTEEVEEALAAV